MANTVTLLGYANTFGDWVVTTNALAIENNNMAANNYIKPSGTLYLNDPTLGLQVGNNAIFAGQLQVTGVGSSAYVQNNLRVDTQVYFTNTSLGLTNSGQANIGGPLLALGANTGLQVSNSASIGANVIVYGTGTIVGAANLGNTLIVTGAATLSNTLSVLKDASFTANINAAKYINVTNDVNATDFIATQLISGSNLNIVNNAQIGGQLAVTGNFIINGTTVYNTNTFTINANSNVGLTSTFAVNRGVNANAAIRWNEANTYWDIRDVNNPTGYSKILTANLISDSVITVNSSGLASQTAANTLNNSIIAVNTLLSASITNFQNQITSNTNLQLGINATQNTASLAINNYANSAYARANTSLNQFNGTTGSINPSNGLVTFSSDNGMTIVASGNNLDISSPQDLRTSASPTFAGLTLNGTPTAPTATNGTSTTQIATTAYVLNQLGSGGTYGHNISGNAATAYGLGVQTAGSVPGANQVLRSDGSGYIFGSYFNSNTSNNENPTVSQVLVTNGADGYYRKSSIGSFTTQLTGTASSLTAGLANGVNQNPNRTDSAWYQAVWSNAAGGDKAIYSTGNVTINSGSYGAVGFYGSSWSIGGNPTYGLITNTGLYVSGQVWATSNITAYYSDMRLKKYLGPIENPLDKIMSLNGFYYEANETAQALGYKPKREVGVSAQEVQAIMPEIVSPAPIDNQYLTIDYERLVPLLIECVKALKLEIDELKKK